MKKNPDSKKNILSVAEFIDYINDALRPFSKAIVEGEVSDFSINRNKWVSFELKDENTKQILSCFTTFKLFQGMNLEEVLEEGMCVQVEGGVKVRKRGNFSMFTRSIKLAGEGTLKKAYKNLKEKLKKEGFFSEARKRDISPYPERVGIITSREAKAFSDFQKVLADRIGGIRIYHTDAHVQGDDAVPEIVGAFHYFNTHQDDFDLDLIVLTRGGGSLEDLQAFNSEKVARAVFSSNVPVVCGVGHEEDITLAGLTADLRASTPSNAAELIVKTRKEISQKIESSVYRIETALRSDLKKERGNLERFYRAVSSFLNVRKRTVIGLLKQFKREFLLFDKGIQEQKQKVQGKSDMLLRRLREDYLKAKRFISYQKSLLLSYSPRSVLKRGYGIIRRGDKIVRRAEEINEEDNLDVELYEGSFRALVKEIFDS